MTVIQTPSKAWGIGGRPGVSGPALALAVIIVAALCVAVFATSLTSRQNLVGAKADPQVGPAAIEFRANERAVGAAQGDPLLKPAAVEFRADEHAASGLTLQEMQSLRGEAAGSGVQIHERPNRVDFKFRP